jgi:hypothetical protein
MGLDMYLSKKSYVKNWNHNPIETHNKITITQGGQVRKDIKPERISHIVEEVGYWRKFNALHGWFVNECGNGVDDCSEYYVSTDKLKELLGILKQVSELITKSKKTVKILQDWNGEDYEEEVYDCSDEVIELFPPIEGFFFGSTEIDELFKDNVNDTITLLEELLDELEEDDWSDFYYQASW